MVSTGSLILAAQNALLLLVACLAAVVVISFLSGLLASTAGGLVADYLTFPGVIHHELSHALLASVCGARVTRVVLFKIDHADGQLGYIEYVPRGSRVLQNLQKTMSGVAPVLCGAITVSLFYVFVLPGVSGWGMFLVWYLMVSIAVHMNLSRSDWRNAGSGLLAGATVFFLVAFLFFLVSGVDLIAVFS